MVKWAIATLALALTGCTSDGREMTEPLPAPPPPPGIPQGAAVIAFVSTRDGGGPVPGQQSESWIYLAMGDGSSVRRLTRGAAPAWSPDGQRLAFHRSSRGSTGDEGVRLVVCNRDGTGERVLVLGGQDPSWSPDGTRIAYSVGGFPPEAGIYVVNANGHPVPRKLIDDSFAFPDDGYVIRWVGYPGWSPDGTRISFLLVSDGIPAVVYLMSAGGSNPRLLSASLSVGNSPPRWKPDGSRLLLMIPHWSTDAGLWSIVSVAPDGSDMRRHAEGTYVGAPAWFADGSSIAYQSFSAPPTSTWPLGSRMRIYASTLGDGTRRQLVPEAVNPANPDYWDTEPALWGVHGGGDSGAGDWDYQRNKSKPRGRP